MGLRGVMQHALMFYRDWLMSNCYPFSASEVSDNTIRITDNDKQTTT